MDRIREKLTEIFFIKTLKWFFLSIGFLGLFLLIKSFIYIEMVEEEIVSFSFGAMAEDTDSSTISYYIIFGFNTFSLFNYLESVVRGRDDLRAQQDGLRQDISNVRNSFNDLMNTRNMDTQIYNNIQGLSFDNMMQYQPRDRVLLAYQKLRWMDKTELENTRSFGTKQRQELLLQIHIDEKELGYTHLMKGPDTFDMGALSIDLSKVHWDELSQETPKVLKKQPRNPKNRVPLLTRKLGKTSKERRERKRVS